MSSHELYPYSEIKEEYSFPGEMPVPEPVGFGDPGISSLKANADHSHAPDTSTGTVVQERLVRFTGNWIGPSTIALGTWYLLGNIPLMTFAKKFGGTNLRFIYGFSMFNTVGSTVGYIGASPTNSPGDIVVVGVFGLSITNNHAGFTGAVEIPNRGAADYNITWWVQAGGNVTSDAWDMFWGRVAEVWP